MATSSLIGRRVFLAAAKRSTYQQALQSSALRAASTTSHYSHGDSSSASASRFGLLGAAGAFALAANATNEKADCCGIAGVVGAKGDARDYLIEGLTILKNRGYDSAGIATMDDANPELVVSLLCVYFYRSAQIYFIYPFTSNNSPSSITTATTTNSRLPNTPPKVKRPTVSTLSIKSPVPPRDTTSVLHTPDGPPMVVRPMPMLTHTHPPVVRSHSYTMVHSTTPMNSVVNFNHVDTSLVLRRILKLLPSLLENTTRRVGLRVSKRQLRRPYSNVMDHGDFVSCVPIVPMNSS